MSENKGKLVTCSSYLACSITHSISSLQTSLHALHACFMNGCNGYLFHCSKRCERFCQIKEAKHELIYKNLFLHRSRYSASLHYTSAKKHGQFLKELAGKKNHAGLIAHLKLWVEADRVPKGTGGSFAMNKKSLLLSVSLFHTYLRCNSRLLKGAVMKVPKGVVDNGKESGGLSIWGTAHLHASRLKKSLPLGTSGIWAHGFSLLSGDGSTEVAQPLPV